MNSGRFAQLRSACARPVEHPDMDELRRASQSVIDWVLGDFADLPQRSVGYSESRSLLESALRETAPEQGIGFEQVLHQFRNKVAPHGIRATHPRFLAFVPSGANFVSVLGDWLCDGMNIFAGTWFEGAAAAQLELVVIDWFRQILGLPHATGGVLTSGGSEAILTALVAARAKLTDEQRQRAIIYTSDQRHWSLDRGAYIAGFRSDQLHVLPADRDLRMSVTALRRAVEADERAGRLPWLVFANAGTTNTAAVDPLVELADFSRNRNLWLHVDAAYGWAAALTAERELLHGIDLADSVSLDPHKWFAQTYDVGCVLVRDDAALTRAFAMRPEYMQDVEPGAGEVNFCDRGIALTRRFRALKIWMSVKTLGLGWFRRMVEHSCKLAEFAELMLRQVGEFEIISPRQMSVLCFRFVPEGWANRGEDLDALNRAICAEASATGRVFVCTTRLKDMVAARICFVNWRTTAADVEDIVQLLHATGRRLAGKGSTR